MASILHPRAAYFWLKLLKYKRGSEPEQSSFYVGGKGGGK